MRLPERVREAAERLQGVVVEHRPADWVIGFYDTTATLFYCDPPYHPQTCDCSGYQHTLKVEAHEALAAQLREVQGMVVLSGYQHPDYDRWYEGWHRRDRIHTCGAAAAEGKPYQRVESLWFNPLAWENLQASRAETA